MSEIQFDTATYDAFGVLLKTGDDTLMYIYRQGVLHQGGASTIVKRTYTISTETWGAASTVYEDANTVLGVRGVGGGIIGTKIHIFFAREDTASPYKRRAIVHLVSTDLTGSSWSMGALTQVINTTQTSYNSLRNGGDTRAGQRIDDLPASTITYAAFYLRKYGSPTGTATVNVRKVSDDSVIGSLGTLNVATLTTDFQFIVFDTPVAVSSSQDVRILLEYSGGDVSNTIQIGRTSNGEDYCSGCFTRYDSSWTDYATRDATVKIEYTTIPTEYAAFNAYGPLISTDDPDTFLQTLSDHNGVDSFKSKLFKTTDGGDTWSVGATIATSTGATQWLEPSAAYIGDSKIVCHLRDDAINYVGQSVSSDNGETWSAVALTNLGDNTGDTIVWLYYDSSRSKLIEVFHDRSSPYRLKISEADALTVYADETLWGTPEVLDSGFEYNGYAGIAEISSSVYKIVYSKQVSGSDADIWGEEVVHEAGYEWAVEALTEAAKVYCEAHTGTNIDTRRDITDETEEDRTTIIAAMKAAYPGSDTYYKHSHHHYPGNFASCGMDEV